MRTLGRAIGLDVHLQFCEVAIVEAGAVCSAGRIETTPEKLELFAQSLSPADRVALEVTASAWAIAEILVAKVVVVSPADTNACCGEGSGGQATGVSACNSEAMREPHARISSQSRRSRYCAGVFSTIERSIGPRGFAGTLPPKTT